MTKALFFFILSWVWKSSWTHLNPQSFCVEKKFGINIQNYQQVHAMTLWMLAVAAGGDLLGWFGPCADQWWIFTPLEGKWKASLLWAGPSVFNNWRQHRGSSCYHKKNTILLQKKNLWRTPGLTVWGCEQMVLQHSHSGFLTAYFVDQTNHRSKARLSVLCLNSINVTWYNYHECMQWM